MTNPARDMAVKHYTTSRPDLEHQLAFFSALWEAQDAAAADSPTERDTLAPRRAIRNGCAKSSLLRISGRAEFTSLQGASSIELIGNGSLRK